MLPLPEAAVVPQEVELVLHEHEQGVPEQHSSVEGPAPSLPPSLHASAVSSQARLPDVGSLANVMAVLSSEGE